MSDPSNYVSKIKNINPINFPNPFVGNYIVYYKMNGYIIPSHIFQFILPDQFGEIYTVEFSSGGHKMVQWNIFEMDIEVSIFSMTCESTEKFTGIEASPGTNGLFFLNWTYHEHPPCTDKWDSTSIHKNWLVVALTQIYHPTRKPICKSKRLTQQYFNFTQRRHKTNLISHVIIRLEHIKSLSSTSSPTHW